MVPVATKRNAFIIRTIPFSARQELVNTREKRPGETKDKARDKTTQTRNRNGESLQSEMGKPSSQAFFSSVRQNKISIANTRDKVTPRDQTREKRLKTLGFRVYGLGIRD